MVHSPRISSFLRWTVDCGLSTKPVALERMNIILVGFMGTGKTAVGEKVAVRLNLRYVSTDDLIIEREKRGINEIFARSGEPYFRRVEKEVVKEVSSRDGQVVDAGGGVVLNEENVHNLKKNGVVICLRASPETVLERTRKYGHRPLLNVSDPLAEIKRLLEFRAPFYARADHIIDTTDLTLDEVVEKVIDLYRN